LNRWIYTNF